MPAGCFDFVIKGWPVKGRAAWAASRCSRAVSFPRPRPCAARDRDDARTNVRPPLVAVSAALKSELLSDPAIATIV